MIPISKPIFDKKEERAVIKVLRSGILTQGKLVEIFEKKFAEYIGTKYAIATSSGTTALHIALLAHGIVEGDEVITTPFSFIASSNAILYCGAKPVFVDISEEDFNINPDLIEEKITKKTKAILVVHLYGNPARMDKIMKIAKKHNLVVIEDACQAHGASIKNKKVGSFGTGCFSFYPTKNMTTGEGGMITTNSKEIYEKAKLLRNHGMKVRYYHEILGFNFRMTEIAAAIGIEQLKKLDFFNEKRIKNAEFYNKNIKKEGIILPKVRKNYKHVFHQYTLRVTEKCPKTREEIIEILKNEGIQTSIYYHLPIYKQKPYLDLGFNEELPVTERLCEEVLSIPVYATLTQKDLRKIASIINSI
jgi:dTDP-4-amino-4,6-dideoxygalactose transaminase